MPKVPTDYSRTVIYKIQHIDDDTLLYIGSTNNFTKRKWSHKSSCNNVKNKDYDLKLYRMIRGSGGWDEFNMVVLKEFPCANKREAEMEEDILMREMKAQMNTRNAYSSKEDKYEYLCKYKTDNRERIAEVKKIYDAKNKERIAEVKKIYHDKNKERIAEVKKIYDAKNKERKAEVNKIYQAKNKVRIAEVHKIYQDKNREAILQKQREFYQKNKIANNAKKKMYYEANKAKISARSSQEITCDCGCVIARHSFAQHKKTKKHIALMELIL
jgi:hypothetical protein